MANPNGFWKKAGLVFTVGTFFFGVVAGYCDTKFKANTNEKEIIKLDKKVEKKSDNIEKKMDEFSREQTTLKIQTAQILEMVKYLKEKAK